MFTVLITWMVLGNLNTMDQQIVPAEMCEGLRAEAVMQPTIKAAACVHTTEMAMQALTVGKCQPLDTAANTVIYLGGYACNGRLPNWK